MALEGDQMDKSTACEKNLDVSKDCQGNLFPFSILKYFLLFLLIELVCCLIK